MAVTREEQRSLGLFPPGYSPPADWRDRVARDPHRPGPDRWRLRDEGFAVWAIIGQLQARDAEFTAETIAETADDYRIPIAAVLTAIAYYEQERAAIDTRLAINAAAVE